MTFTEAAEEVLRLVGRPLHYKEITAYAIEKSLLSHVGKSPEVTMGARLAALFKKPAGENPLIRIRPGVFALHEWEASGQLKQMLAKVKPPSRSSKSAAAPATPPADEPTPPAEAEVDAPPQPQEAEPEKPAATKPAESPPVEPPAPEPVAEATAPPESKPPEPEQPSDHDAEPPPAGEPAVSGSFDEEEDDDQPILTNPEAIAGDREVSRRRRRRRRRPKGNADGGNGSPAAYSASPNDGASSLSEPRAFAPSSGGPNPVVLDVTMATIDQVPLDDFAAKDMADAIALVLGTLDRASGPVSLRQIAEAAQRRVRLAGDIQQLQSQIAASVRADNLRRVAVGQRPRFRFVGGRIALTDWLLTSDLARYEREAMEAVERYREAAQKAFVRKLQELPGPAFVELVLLVLERIGFRHVRAMRRAGIPGQEAHFTAIHVTGASDIRSALVIRKDAREIGRERVTELRGSLHHYGPAAVGWLVTAGLVLSGAREEAAATHSSGIVPVDGAMVAKLCEQHDVAVVRSTMPVAIPDLDVLEALRAS